MPGPMPKDPAVRQRRNKSSSRAVLLVQAGQLAEKPRLPNCPDGEGWHNMAKRWWDDVWSSPMCEQYLQGDLPALFRLVVLVDTFWKSGALNVAKEIRLLEREFGLTPLARRRLEWTVAQAEEATDRLEYRRSKRARDVTDPREVLDK